MPCTPLDTGSGVARLSYLHIPSVRSVSLVVCPCRQRSPITSSRTMVTPTSSSLARCSRFASHATIERRSARKLGAGGLALTIRDGPPIPGILPTARDLRGRLFDQNRNRFSVGRGGDRKILR